MKIFMILFASLFLNPLSSESTKMSSNQEIIKVYIFLHGSCRISQYYTLTLKELHEKYGSNRIVFEGIFPNPDTEQTDLDTFKEKYDLDFEMLIDYNQNLTNELGATITPEVVVYNSTQKKILYKGRIDNAYFRVGKRRQVTTTSELQDVLEAIQNDKPVKVESKEAIGCFIRKI